MINVIEYTCYRDDGDQKGNRGHGEEKGDRRGCGRIQIKCICIALFTRKHVTEGFTYAHRTAPQPTQTLK